ncbi:ATP-grasp domain-containing protein [Sphingomonas sp. KC8]|uniref:ATP-grasp domain-containing protein n=1 Tax=Sphingomonas sp. KC8 TaxID=1030157 RepID=UPI0002488F2B|nr:ATP-grasp domain-containing protein [Sphingomonas sp. KC8]ARS29004.1 hypothetical protein KC8_17175 [Sphingomonas sp. KC8]
MPDGQIGQRGNPAAGRLLLTSAGRRVALVDCFRESAAALGITLDVLACDLAPEWSSACCAADRAFAVPPVAAPDYIPALLEICRREQVTMLVPTIDPELAPLAAARAAFAAIGVDVVVSDPAVVAIAGDKLATSRWLLANGVAAPIAATPDDVLGDASAWNWPLLAKPRHGSSGRSVTIVADAAQLRSLDMREPFVVQELLRGEEFTVNIFIDKAGALRCAVPHRRVQIRAGEVEKGVTVRHDALCRAAVRLAAGLSGARGPLCFQAMVNGTDAPIFEINARFGGGYPLAHRAGAVFTRWLLEEAMCGGTRALDDWAEGMVMLRYDAAMFVAP